MKRVKAMPKLTKLSIAGSRVTDAGLAAVAGLTELDTLAIHGLTGLKGSGLQHLKALTKVRILNLGTTGITDEGFAGIQGLTQLQTLQLPLGLTDAGFVHLKGLTELLDVEFGRMPGLKGPGLQYLADKKNITALALTETGVTDEGLKHIAGMKQLRSLYLPPQIGDAGLAHLVGLTELADVSLAGSKVTDAGLAHLKGLTKLAGINLVNTGITDAGLAHLKGLPALRNLYLNGTAVTDAAVNVLKGMSKLNVIGLHQTALTANAVADLKKTFPMATIQYSPAPRKADPAFVAALKGFADVQPSGDALFIQVKNNAKDEDLAKLAKGKGPIDLYLSGVPNLTDAGLAHLKDLKEMRTLSLAAR